VPYESDTSLMCSSKIHHNTILTFQPHVYSQMKFAILPSLPSHRVSSHVSQYLFPVLMKVGGRVCGPEWLVTYEVVCRPRDDHPAQY